MDKNRNVKEDIHRERVILKKEGRHVKVSGAYTKRELRKLLYSSTSILQSDDESRTKRSLKSDIKLSQVDLDKIKEDKIEEISKKDKRILPKDLHVTIDVIRNVPRKNKEKVKNILLRDDKRKRINEKSLREHLRDIGLSDSLIKALLTNGFTDEYIRLLKALGFLEDDIERLKLIWKKESYDSTDSIESDDICVSSKSSMSDYYLSPECHYLKYFLSNALVRALPEIAMKKPYDPIEYLGHWLLHSKICEERRNKQKEFEMELMIEREKYKMMIMKDRDTIKEEIREEEEGEGELTEDWNFINYEII
ncbi:hypothetical protein M0802_000833 [Mischocyttarus mexicanus]|nr:hypothetical protein M0802_000833 [Mischocyttarus mexicanus]